MSFPAHIWYNHPRIALVVAGFGVACLIYLWVHLIFGFELIIVIPLLILFLIFYEILVYIFVIKKKR